MIEVLSDRAVRIEFDGGLIGARNRAHVCPDMSRIDDNKQDEEEPPPPPRRGHRVRRRPPRGVDANDA